MGALWQGGPGRGRRVVVVSALACTCMAGPGFAAGKSKAPVDLWQAALIERQRFEALPPRTHTRTGYAHVMDGFRAIYHGDPADVYAPRAIAQVAELLAEEGREFGDRKSLHDAAGEYEFLASQYPAASLAPEALLHALDLLGPEAANDPVELRKVRTQLASDYPKYARVMPARDMVRTPRRDKRGPDVADMPSTAIAASRGNPPSRSDPFSSPSAPVASTAQPDVHAETPVAFTAIPVRSAPVADETKNAPVAQVTGIRHWSTSTYTRVAIDLGDEVQYEAARVEHPDRIFFDLHHAKLAPQLVGKSFTVTDDGFLTKVRAAQFSGDITRVVLDVHEVTEYSAFLLPNPYRLIIDIHGKRDPNSEQLTVNSEQESQGIGNREQGIVKAERKETGAPTVEVASDAKAPENVSTPPAKADKYVPRSRRTALSPASSTTNASSGPAEVSSLPPMPVTDGSGAFGLPPKGSAAPNAAHGVAQPRVVIPSKSTQSKPVPNTVVTHASDSGTALAAVSEQPGKVEATSRPTSQPIVDRAKGLGPRGQKTSARTAGVPAQPAPPTAEGETSLVRALGLKIGRIVIDAGHGGHDSGTLGVDGIEEKDIVLDVALRLGKLLHDRLGAEIVYTRADDTFIPLETRTAIANKAQADLFISVHANSSPDPSARGIEVYYLNFTSDPEAMQVASRENAVSTQNVHDLSELVKKITLKDKIEESRELAADVDQSLYKGLAKGNEGLRDRGVKKAPFVVLIGANMPSILAEISFVTNPDDADQLARPQYRQRVAESLYGGVARYAAAINGSKMPATQRAAAGGR